MDNNNPNSTNKLNEHSDSAENQPSGFKEEKSKEIKEVQKGIEEFADIGAENVDASVETNGEVSEVISNTREKKGSGVSSGQQPARGNIADIKANLLKTLPSEKEMRKQIDKEIDKEISYLHKRAIKMARMTGKVDYFEMNNLIKKIRSLKGLLVNLMKCSFEGLKTLWLRFVHGIM
ncbi:MAG: hypothetical protein WC806_01025 [Candidatus Gracilibacteria bacterium]|jgi:hypothetical protein